MSAGKLKIILVILSVLGSAQKAWPEPARVSLQDGNKLYGRGNYNEAISRYDEALIEEPQALEQRFNKGNSYYRLDDLAKAQDLYREVAAESKDMELVTKAKYNLGNSYFQQGMKQRDSNLQKTNMAKNQLMARVVSMLAKWAWKNMRGMSTRDKAAKMPLTVPYAEATIQKTMATRIENSTALLRR